MKQLILGAVLAALLAGFAGRARAQEMPNVRGLTPFSPQTNYMSLPGYLRWRTFETAGRWITWDQAISEVRNQTAVAALPPSG